LTRHHAKADLEVAVGVHRFVEDAQDHHLFGIDAIIEAMLAGWQTAEAGT